MPELLMTSIEIVRAYLDAAIQQLRHQGVMRLPTSNIPQEMRDESVHPQDDWIGWKPVPSTVTDGELDVLEREIGLAYPQPYRSFLQTAHFCVLTEVGIRFAPHSIHGWKNELRKGYHGWLPDRILGRGLIPFGSETYMDAGPVCFDTVNRFANGDCPVVFWDHERIDTDREVQPVFSSSLAMFHCLHHIATAELDFVYHDSNYDDPALLPRKRDLMQRFLSIDPKGAGGVAREYWTSWGVNPDA